MYIFSDNLSRNSCIRWIGGGKGGGGGAESGSSCSNYCKSSIRYPEEKLYVVFVVDPGLDPIRHWTSTQNCDFNNNFYMLVVLEVYDGDVFVLGNKLMHLE